MINQRLGQALLVQPAVPFTEIEHVLQKLGWTREDGLNNGSSLIKGEPEVATWTRNGVKPFVIYTFNPVVSMRVLDVATLPPVMRAQIADKLKLIDDKTIAQLFKSEDIKERLLALWVAQETERVDLMPQVAALKNDAESVIAQQAEVTTERLATMDRARMNMLTQLKVLSETAPQLIAQLDKPSFVQTLKPSKNDLEKLFDEYLAEPLSLSLEAVYQQGPRVDSLQSDACIDVWACPAGLLRWPNMLSNKFPGGYRDIAGWMNPHRIWLAWTITTPQGGTTRYDGLVWLDDRWLWLPKVFRYLTPLLMMDPAQVSSRH